MFSTLLRGTIFCHNPVTVETTNPKPVASFDETSLGTAPNVGPLDPPLGPIFHGCDCSGFYRLRWHLKHQCFSYAVWIAFPFRRCWIIQHLSKKRCSLAHFVGYLGRSHFLSFKAKKNRASFEKSLPMSSFSLVPLRDPPNLCISSAIKKNFTTSSWMRLLARPSLPKQLRTLFLSIVGGEAPPHCSFAPSFSRKMVIQTLLLSLSTVQDSSWCWTKNSNQLESRCFRFFLRGQRVYFLLNSLDPSTRKSEQKSPAIRRFAVGFFGRFPNSTNKSRTAKPYTFTNPMHLLWLKGRQAISHAFFFRLLFSGGF